MTPPKQLEIVRMRVDEVEFDSTRVNFDPLFHAGRQEGPEGNVRLVSTEE